MMYNLLFFGHCVNQDIVTALSESSVPGNIMELNVLKRLCGCGKFATHSYTVYPVAAFPKDKKVIYNKAIIPVAEKISSLRVPFVNLTVLKQITIACSIYRHAKNIARKHPNAIIFAVNMLPQVGLPSCWLKKKYPSVTLVAFLPDLPIGNLSSCKWLKRKASKVFYRIAEKAILKADKLVVLNKNAAMKYAPGKPYIVAEGGVNAEEVPDGGVPIANRDKVIVFSGSLIEHNGVIELVEAMKLITTRDVKMHIYGDGALKNVIASAAAKADNIEYKGAVDNETMKQIQREAYLLINPRPVDDPIAMVTFPSKIFEYLMSGTPVLTTRLNGFTEEYYDKMYFTETNNPQEMAAKIDEIMALPPTELGDIAQKARTFVLEEKSWDKQMRRVVEFIMGGTV